MSVSKRYFASILLLLALISSLSWQRSLAQFGGEEYFEETGHRVTGEFLTKFHSVSNPLQLYGYPITEAYQDPTNHLLIQYFQKARFELFLIAPVSERVQFTPLGQYLYNSGVPAPLPATGPACRTFDKGFQVCYSLLEFYLANGGEAQFGKPISNTELHDNVIVQYFQNTRFEWHPELPAGQRVVLANLGKEYFSVMHENPVRLKSEPGSNGNTNNGTLSLKVHAYPTTAVTSRNGMQTIYAIVQDQRLLPVKDAQVTITLTMPAGDEIRHIVPILTNEKGVTQYTFPFNTNDVGIVQVTVTASSNNLEAKTTTSFRVWW
jgi:hypothetical protein